MTHDWDSSTMLLSLEYTTSHVLLPISDMILLYSHLCHRVGGIFNLQYHRLNMELDLQSLSLVETPQPHLRIWAHLRGRYWSAKIDDISL
jgi:hypothetical protein